MGYYIRFLSPDSAVAPKSVLSRAIDGVGLPLTVSGDPAEIEWQEIDLAHSGGKPIAAIEHYRVDPSITAEGEIAEFLEEISTCQPASASAWLTSYLPAVRVIYVVQVFSGVSDGRGWDVIGAVLDALRTSIKGIVQADGEGFTNEDGDHILWQFSPDVTGACSMAVLTQLAQNRQSDQGKSVR